MTSRRARRNSLSLAAAVTLALGITACSSPAAQPADAVTSTPPTPTSSAATSAPAPTNQPEQTEDDVVGTRVNFTAGNVTVEVVIEQDNPTTRSFLAMLPMTLEFSDYGGKEKVATPTGEWDFTNAEGLNPQVGDLFSYMPWGNLGFFYNTGGNTFDDSLTKIGETEDIDQIVRLDGQQVTIDVAG